MCTEFAKRLKLLREEHSIQQKELAKYLDYVGSAISNYETGRNEPSLRQLVKIADFFDVSVDYLVGHSDVKKPGERFDFNEIYKKFEKITLAQALKIISEYQKLVQSACFKR